MLDARKRTIPAGGDPSVSRVTIFEAFGLSINDVVPVVNATERAQVVTDLNAKNQGPTSSRPLIVSRADARGLHRIEYSYDGTVWLPASSELTFASVSDATSWATSNPSLLTAGDECIIAGVAYVWQGGAWRARAAQIANPGTTIAGVEVQQTAANVAVLMRSGIVVSGTSVSFGNGYMPPIGLDFPTGVMSLQLTPIVADGATSSSAPLSFDVFKKDQFRAFYPGDNTSAKRAFSWVAWGF